MSTRELTEVSGMVMDDEVLISLGELCRACGLSAEVVMDMVEEGVLDPCGGEPVEWRFSGTSVKRVQMALRLSHDLRVNLPGAALALDLMDELQELRQTRRRIWLIERI